MQEPRAASKKS